MCLRRNILDILSFKNNLSKFSIYKFRNSFSTDSKNPKSGSGSTSGLKDALREKIPAWVDMVKTVRKEHGNKKIGDITVNHVYMGMRGMYGLVWETSEVKPDGIIFRGLDIQAVDITMPKPEGSSQPYIEGFLWFLMTGDIPTPEQAQKLAEELAHRAQHIPPDVLKTLDAADKCWHPMSLYSMVFNCLSNHSKFNQSFHKGVKKAKYWEDTYEDGLDIIALAPRIAGMIYRKKHYEGSPTPWHEKCDMAVNFATIMNKADDKQFIEFVRLYMILHSDHEGGNASAHTMHLVNSTLSDLYKSYAASMNALAGPLHGLATQTTLEWVNKLIEKHGNDPTDQQIASFVDETLKSGSVVPGYGHAVLRDTDPRFLYQMKFAQDHKIDTPAVKVVAKCYKIIPEILKKGGKVKNPNPNVDAHSGALLDYFKIDVAFFTVMFGISRALGVVTSSIWSRALGHPIERPKSITTCRLRKLIAKQSEGQPQKRKA